jgi:hypothetical protein
MVVETQHATWRGGPVVQSARRTTHPFGPGSADTIVGAPAPTPRPSSNRSSWWEVTMRSPVDNGSSTQAPASQRESSHGEASEALRSASSPVPSSTSQRFPSSFHSTCVAPEASRHSRTPSGLAAAEAIYAQSSSHAETNWMTGRVTLAMVPRAARSGQGIACPVLATPKLGHGVPKIKPETRWTGLPFTLATCLATEMDQTSILLCHRHERSPSSVASAIAS